ncbi:antibiotic biosynthesis monooxygenase family protein [Novosphingobium aquae]|uniref:Antibiotic biosynthesis monooxygenase family protein n=1 Tax=Novosphingobium aquae TaxID=3133435 RepID=A0ABU8SBR9_9SPHN
MVLERAEFIARDGTGDEVGEMLRTRGLPLAATYTGCLSFRALRCVEQPETFLFLAEWESIEAHKESRHEPAHVEFREMLLPFAAGARETLHFTEL